MGIFRDNTIYTRWTVTWDPSVGQDAPEGGKWGGYRVRLPIPKRGWVEVIPNFWLDDVEDGEGLFFIVGFVEEGQAEWESRTAMSLGIAVERADAMELGAKWAEAMGWIAKAVALPASRQRRRPVTSKVIWEVLDVGPGLPQDSFRYSRIKEDIDGHSDIDNAG